MLFMGKLTISMAIFNSFLFVYQRLTPIYSGFTHWTWWIFPISFLLTFTRPGIPKGSGSTKSWSSLDGHPSWSELPHKPETVSTSAARVANEGKAAPAGWIINIPCKTIVGEIWVALYISIYLYICVYIYTVIICNYILLCDNMEVS